LKKAQTTLLDEKARTYLDECIADARRLLIRQHKYTLDSPELITDDFKKEWRAKTVEVLVEEEARRRRRLKAQMQEEGREKRKEEELLDERKRKRDAEQAWENTREERIESWRDWQKGAKKDKGGGVSGEGMKKKKKMKVLG
jgi:DnaJ homolog subfamily C member 8